MVTWGRDISALWRPLEAASGPAWEHLPESARLHPSGIALTTLQHYHSVTRHRLQVQPELGCFIPWDCLEQPLQIQLHTLQIQLHTLQIQLK